MISKHRRYLAPLAALWALAIALACHAPSSAPADAALEDAGALDATRARYGATTLSPSGDGIPHVRAGVTQSPAAPVDLRDPRDFYPSLPDASAGSYVTTIAADGAASQSQLTTDLINALPAAFSVSLAFQSGGGSFEIGQSTSPTYNATPPTNSASVTNTTIADNQGHSASAISHANPINVDTPGGPHAYSLSSAGNVTVTVTETLIATNTTKSGSATLSFLQRGGWHGVDSHAGGNAITASSSNVTLSGGSASATLTGSTLAGSWVGTSFTENPAVEYIYAAYPHTGSPHQFSAGGFFFPMSVVVPSFSFTNQWGQTSIPIDIYRSDNLLNASFTVLVTQ